MVKQLLTIGWREWVSLPELHVDRIKAKVDTGARTSSLHAYDVHVTEGDIATVRFSVHPIQRSTKTTVTCTVPLVDRRWVRSSNGKRELRPVVVTRVSLPGGEWDIELTLTSRDAMGFRMLLGREALRGRCLVDPGRSFLAGKKARRSKR